MTTEMPTDTFTHAGKVYNLTKVRVLLRDKQAFFLPIKDLLWVLKYDHPSEERIKAAKFRWPLIVAKYNGRWTVVDGLHRLERYRRKGIKVIPVKEATPAILEKTLVKIGIGMETMDSFDHLMQMDTMSDCYLELTKNATPDRALLSFIHFEELEKAGALESFDVQEYHQKTLDQIAENPYFEMACEGFVDSLKSSIETMKNFITFNTAKPFSHFASAQLEEVHSNILVRDYNAVKRLLTLHNRITTVLGWILENIPKAKTYDDWKKYHQQKFKQGAQFDIIKARDKVAELRRETNKVARRGVFEDGEWTPEKFKSAIHDYERDVASMIAQTRNAADLLMTLRVTMTMSKYTKKHKNVIASMKRAVYMVNGAVEVCRVLQNQTLTSLKQVSRHYEVKK